MGGLREASWYPGVQGCRKWQGASDLSTEGTSETSPLHLLRLVGVRACVRARVCTHGVTGSFSQFSREERNDPVPSVRSPGSKEAKGYTNREM